VTASTGTAQPADLQRHRRSSNDSLLVLLLLLL
jgi:hypothetical protein